MIISNIVGGLGNQMFQFAFVYAFSKKNHQEIRLDTSVYKNRKYINPEGFLLRKLFQIESKTARYCDYFKVLGIYAPLLVLKNKIPLEKICKDYIKEENIFCFDEDIFKKLSKKKYVNGWWQVPKYFEDFKEEITELYTFDLDLIEREYINKAKKIESEESVSIHVRLGDYVNNDDLKRIYYVCDEDYYKRAIENMSNKFPSAKFYIFSDDIDEAKKLEIFSGHTFIENKNVSSWNDMYLMSKCKHSIIANSSFSWWGAYLNKNPQKVTIAPSRWLANKTPTPDILPSNWLKL